MAILAAALVAGRIAAWAGLLVLLGLPIARILEPRGPRRGDDLVARAGLAAAFSLAILPLAQLWAASLGLAGRSVDPGLAGLLLAAAAAALAGRRVSLAPTRPGTLGLVGLGQPPALPARAAGAARAARVGLAPAAVMGGLLVATLAARAADIAGLAVPFWGDSVHHSMIVRLFQLGGGLPRGWEPFAPLTSFSYHFGFHAGAAALASWARLDAPRAVLLHGQALMLLQPLTAYALAARLTGRPWAGVGAALAAAGLSPMPAFYLNWGRYTQLAGQVVLPAAALLTLLAAAAPKPDRRRLWPAAAVLLAGLFLTHYLVLAFWGLLVLAWLGLRAWRRRGAGLFAAIGALAAVGAMSAALTAPWLPRLAGGLILRSATRLSTTRVADPDVYGVLADPWAMWRPAALAQNVGWPLLAAAGAALLAVAAFRGRPARVVRRADGLGTGGLAALALGWLAMLLLAIHPERLGIPVTGPLKDFTVAIALYLPLGLLVGAGLAAAMDAGRRAGPGAIARETGPALLALLLVGAVAGGTARDESFRLVLPDDEAALGWVRAQTPADARFLVGSFSAFGQTVQAGDDAGWWLPLLAAPRGSTLPPITVGLERSGEPGYRESVNALAALWRADLDSPQTLRALRLAGVGYAFVGVRGQVLDRAALAASPCWRRVHARDSQPADGRPGAAVYRLLGPGCLARPPAGDDLGPPGPVRYAPPR